jgi:hypothetical protein
VIEGVRRTLATDTATAQFSTSSNGALAFLPGPAAPATGGDDLAWFDRKNPPQALKLPGGSYSAPRLSPDGKWVAFEKDDGGDANVWLYELSGASAIRQLTFGGSNRAPVWSGDSRWVAFQSDREGDAAVFQQRADGSSTAERLTTAEAGTVHIPQSWSSDNAHLLFTEVKNGQSSLWDLAMRGRRASPLAAVQSPDLLQAAFSPDDRWVAYEINEVEATTSSGDRTYVQPFPPTGVKYVLPFPAGHPLWSRKGDQLIVGCGQTCDAVVPVTTSPVFAFGVPSMFSRGAWASGPSTTTRRNHDAAPDGRILGVLAARQAGGRATEIVVVLNWQEELKRRVSPR